MRHPRSKRRRPSLLLTSAIGAAALAAASTAATDASALQVFGSDCNFGFQDVYNPGDAVCVSGEMDVVPPGKICAEGYVVVTPANNANPFADVTAGGANYILGCAGAGAFFDEYVWLPPLKPGQYELVIDQYPFFGAFGAEDYRTGGTTIVVSNAPVVFSVNPAAIKAAAMDGLKQAAAINDLVLYLTILDTLSTAADWAGAFGLWGGAAAIALGIYCYKTNTDCPTSYDSAIITIGNKILSGIAASLTAKYGTLVADPPNPNFGDMVPLAETDMLAQGGPWTPAASHPIAKGQTALATLLGVQTAGYQALVPTLEKLQGAQIAGDHLGMYRQADKLGQYVTLLSQSGDAMSAELDALEVAFQSEGVLNTGVNPADVQGALDGIAANGFSAQDEDALRSFGLGDAEIAQVRADLAALPPVPADLTPNALLQNARQMVNAMKPALADLAMQAQAVKDENAPYAFNPGPSASLSAPATGKVGVPLTLTASGTHFDPQAALSYAWDTDLDGVFDDGATSTLMHTPAAPGRSLVSVRVTDPSGNVDVAHAVIDVTLSNEPPEVTSLSPLDPAPFAGVGAEVAFHVEATDPDGDPLSYNWHVDGASQGTGQDFHFTMPDEEPHTVEVIVSDNDPYSPDARTHSVVRAAKWEGGGGSGGTGGSGGGGPGGSATGGDGSGGNGNGGNPAGGNGNGGNPAGGNGETGGGAGCGCGIAGDTGVGAGSALSLLALAAVLRRRRRDSKSRLAPSRTSTL